MSYCFFLQTIGCGLHFFFGYSGCFVFLDGFIVWDALSLPLDLYRSVVISEMYSRLVFEMELDLYCINEALHSFSRQKRLYSSADGWDFHSFFTTLSPWNSDATSFPLAL